MHKNHQIYNTALARIDRNKRSLRIFLSVLALVASARTILSRRKEDRKRGKAIVDRSAVQIALLPALLPQVYTHLRDRFGPSGLAELLSSPFLLLLPASWRIHAVLYAASSALYHSGRSSKWRRYLPPTWTLNVIGNAFLLWAFLFKSEAFPSAYEKVILSNSTYYVPRDMSKPELEGLLRNTTFSEATSNSSVARADHAYDLCAKLHPTEPSCLKNFLKAWIHESMRTCTWVAAFSMVPTLLSKQQRQMIARNPLVVVRKWLSSTLLGTTFISGSIVTAWAMTCLLQRVLPKIHLRRGRWLINAAVASFWILILPDKRRSEISLYVSRLAALCAWRAWRLDGGLSIPFGDVALFGLSWVQLARLQRSGEKITGVVGTAMAKMQS